MYHKRALSGWLGVVGMLGLCGGRVSAQTQSPEATRTYTVTFADKRVLALPPKAVKPLPASPVLSLTVTQIKAAGKEQVRLVTRPTSDANSAAFFDVDFTQGEQQIPRCRAVFGSVAKSGTGITPYQAILQAEHSTILDGFHLLLPAVQSQATTGAPVFHPLAAQLFLGKMYDFAQGGSRTFALLQDWDGDALNPLSQLATLKLEASGSTILTIDGKRTEARRLKYRLSGTGGIPQEGDLLVGPQGELLQAIPPVFGIPFDGGQAAGLAAQEGDVIVLKTNKGETIKAKQVTDGYEVELYGKPAYPFAVAALDRNFRLTRVSERWNGRERVSQVALGKVLIDFSSSELENITTPYDRAWFLPSWFATGTWEEHGPFANLVPGGKQKGTFIPMILRGPYGQAFTVERLRTTDGSTMRKYRMTIGSEKIYDLYTDGAFLVHLTGSDGIKATQSGYEAFAATVKAPALLEETGPIKQ